MADGQEKKGTVTPFSSLFSSEEVEKAVRGVKETIADRRKELGRLRDFLTDNSSLIRQVQKLPEELSHDIMVPFGGAAFFSGRLIHTNEFLVLLGGGYYAEKSAKQTVEFLQRRGKSLEAQLQSLNRVVKDLELEAKFFDSTATEAAECVVHIREEYVEEAENQKLETDFPSTRYMGYSDEQNSGIHDKEDEHAKLMARLEELKKEEEEAGSDFSVDEYDEKMRTSDDEDEDEHEDGEYEDEDADYVNAKAKTGQQIHEVPAPKPRSPEKVHETSVQHNASKWLQHSSDQSTISSEVQVFPTGSLESNLQQLHLARNPSQLLMIMENLQKAPNIQAPSESSSSSKSSKLDGTTERKAFTGSVIEHSCGLSPAQSNNNSASGHVNVSLQSIIISLGLSF